MLVGPRQTVARNGAARLKLDAAGGRVRLVLILGVGRKCLTNRLSGDVGRGKSGLRVVSESATWRLVAVLEASVRRKVFGMGDEPVCAA
jgi:hypothetical protein